MKNIISVVTLIVISMFLISCNRKEKVVIYSSMEDYRGEYLLEELRREFPQYNIVLEYYSTGTHAAKIKSEGSKIQGDIFVDLDSTYAESLKDNFETLDFLDYSDYLDDFHKSKTEKKYFVSGRFSTSIIVNTDVLTQKGLPEPESYADLLNPIYEDQIMMPNPKTSGTGYMFLLQLVEELGEEEAFAYFDDLSLNMLQYTTSGSGPVNALIRGEIAVALGMIFHGVKELNNGMPLKVITDPMGSPYSTVSNGVFKGKLERKAVKDVIEYIFNTHVYNDINLYIPELVFKSQTEVNMDNFPELTYSAMNLITSIETKERLLGKWEY